MANITQNELHVVFGTGPLGKATMRELVRLGKRVRMVNRSGQAKVPAGVEVVTGDATNPASTREVTKGASVVYQCAEPVYNEWIEKFPAYQAGVIEGAAANHARLVVAENLYMYGPSSAPLREDMPYRATTRKGTLRAKMAEELMTAHRSGKVQATAGRGSNFYGPDATLTGFFGDRVVPLVLQGKKVSMYGNLDAPHTFTFINDFGKGLAILGTHDEAFGQAWHIPNAPVTTTRTVLEEFFSQAGQPAKIGHLPDLMLRGVGLFNPMVREVVEMLYEFNEPFLVDHSQFERAFGNIATPQTEAVRATLDWYRARTSSAVEPLIAVK